MQRLPRKPQRAVAINVAVVVVAAAAVDACRLDEATPGTSLTNMVPSPQSTTPRTRLAWMISVV
jgi:hypothetical protein